VLVFIAAGLVLLYFGLLLVLWRFQEQIVFQPPGAASRAEVDAQRVTYRANDGVELFAYLVGDCNAAVPLVMAFHGNADLARWLLPWASQVARRANACVMIPEYRGYDGLSSAPSYAGSAHDARAAYAFARDSLRVPRERMVYFGHSLGSAIAAELAAYDPPRALVLESPFSSARAMSRRLFVPWVTTFWTLISRVHFDTVERARTLETSVWVAHGENDRIIPVSMGREVFDAARHQGELLLVPGAGHNDVSDAGGRAYWDWLVRAIQSGEPVSASLGARAKTRSAP
jgi:fermentation-respiration switch protein FrsA (DUF1100 family)